ncbi:MAG TPA: hemolysin III family protein [Candidatus Fimivicinus intestinavium]|nr:hemolysin III family protein [Candidatus Fimivicinus intestinavium]
MSLDKVPLIQYGKREDIINSVTHAVGAVFGIVVLVMCTVRAAKLDSAVGVVSSVIYGASMIILYFCSALYHGLPAGNAKRFMRIVDHGVIYLLIAGTITPCVLIALRSENNTAGWVMFGVAWGCALLGIILTLIDFEKFKVMEMVLYIAIGWTLLLVVRPLFRALSTAGIVLVILGGVVYTVGAILYGLGKKVKYFHALFHIFVLAGSTLHFVAVYWYILPIAV